MTQQDDNLQSGGNALEHLRRRARAINADLKKAQMTAFQHLNAALDNLLESTSEHDAAFFPAMEYEALCSFSTQANVMDRGNVSLVLPVRKDDFVGDDLFDDPGFDLVGSQFITLVCVDLSPHIAFLLVSGLPLQKASPEALEDNGLSIRGLTMREAILAARRASSGVNPEES